MSWGWSWRRSLKGRESETVRLRELLAVLGVERYGVSVKGLADEIGKSRVTVSAWVGRGAARRASDSSFGRKVDNLDRRIAKRR